MDDDRVEDRSLADKDGEFEFDGGIDLASPFLRTILSDERPAPNFEGVVPPCGCRVQAIEED